MQMNVLKKCMQLLQKSMTTPPRGLSLIEILMAVSIVSLLAVLLIPKVLTATSTVQSNQVSVCEQTMAQLDQAVQSFTQQTGLSVTPDLSYGNYNYILYNYGSFFIYKSYTPTTGTPVSYYQYMDGSRLSTTPQLFLPTSSFPKVYSTTAADYVNSTLTTTTWGPLSTNSPTTTIPGWCGDYDNNDCVYLDYNGSAPPNNIGKNGDIIPFYIDPTSGHIRTLYQEEVQDNPTATASYLCRFASIYDVITNALNAAC